MFPLSTFAKYLFLLLFFTGSLTACSNAEEPKQIKSITGYINNITENGFLVIEDKSEQKHRVPTAIEYGIASETEIKTQSGNRLKRSDLTVGQRVDTWTTAPVLESYPGQATASLIVVDEEIVPQGAKVPRSNAISIALESVSDITNKLVRDVSYDTRAAVWVIEISDYQLKNGRSILIDAHSGKVANLPKAD